MAANILVIDDDPTARRLLRAYLSKAGYAVTEAEDGQAGWEAFEREHVRLIITDWMMPELDGTELIRRIRHTDPARYTYIIMVTALGSKPQIVTGLEAGADDYLTKPFDPDELLARVAIGLRIINLEESLLASRQQMEFMATHDTVTGILNRRAIQDRAESELNRARRGAALTRLSLILLDIDHFKSVNDRFGHAMGDRALHMVADVLTEQVRSYDSVGRWGGEEFMVLLPATGQSEASIVAERIRRRIAEMALPVAGEESPKLTVSLGVASVSSSAERFPTLEVLLHHADAALYQAKAEGRNRVCFADELKD